VISFNVNIYEKMKRDRSNMIKMACEYIDQINLEYQHAKQDRDNEPLENKVNTAVNKYKLKKIIPYEIIPIKVKGKKDYVQSYKVKYSVNEEELYNEAKHDGILIYITNHTKKINDMHYEVGAGQIVQHYKNKYLIENVVQEFFKHYWTKRHTYDK